MFNYYLKNNGYQITARNITNGRNMVTTANQNIAVGSYYRARNVSNVHVELVSSLKSWPGSLYIDPLVKTT